MRIVRPLVKRALRRLGYALVPAGPSQEPANLLRRFAPDARTIFDVGANVGQSVQLFRSIYPSARIHSFEPDPALFAELRRAAKGDVVLNQTALGECARTTRFNRYAHPVMNSVLPPGRDTWSQVTDTIDVPMTTLDDYCKEHSIDRIDILKTDTQGYDLHVLRGAESALAVTTLIKVELNFASLYQGQSDPIEIMAFLRDRGFVVGALCELFDANGVLGWMDGLFVRKS